MSRKNIIILASTFPRWEHDEVPSFVLDFARHIAPMVDKILVVAPHYSGAHLRDTFEPGIAVKRFRYAYPYRFEDAAYGQFKKTKFYPVKMLSYVASEFWATFLASIRMRPMIINAHWLIPQGFVAVLVGMLTGTKVIISVHGSDMFTLNGKYMRKVKRFTLRYADAVVANSSATQAACMELWPDKSYPIIPMGINVDAFNVPRRNEGKTFEMLFVGRLAPHKGVLYLCEAMNQLRPTYQDMHLTIVGDGSERGAIERFIEEHNLKEAISLSGWVQQSELPAYLAKADVFVGPSVEGEGGEKEALGLVFAEASAAGLPVVGTDVGGIKDVVKNKETGLLVPQKDVAALRDALEYLYTHPQESKAMGKRGRAYVRSNFSWESTSRRYQALLQL